MSRRNITNIEKAPIAPNAVLGLPLRYLGLTDPAGRVYSKTLLANLPLVTIMPGKPMFIQRQGDIWERMTGALGNREREADFIRSMVKFEEGDPNSILEYLSGKVITDRDLRYYTITPAYADYFRYVNLMLSKLHSRMLTRGIFYNFARDYSSQWTNSGIAFYADKSTSVTESADSEYSASKLEELTKTASSLVRELKFVLGADITQDDIERAMGPEANRAVAEEIERATSGGFFDRLMSIGGVDKLATIKNGSQLLYPEVWQDSTFTRNITINFKFYSPYGDPESIFRYVYVPFIALLALALPRQQTLMGYYSPFLVRIDAPGWFQVDTGVVTSLTFKKGGNEELRNKNNLPQEIEVNLQVKDLYPALMMTDQYVILSANSSLSNFLNNMAGVSTTEINFFRDMKSKLREMINRVNPLHQLEELRNRDADFVTQQQFWMNEVFRIK